MCFGGNDDEPEVNITYEGPTEQAKAQLDMARDQRQIYDDIFAPVEDRYLQQVDKDFGGYGASVAAADTAQAVNAARRQAGPMLANRGQATGQMQTMGAAHGAGLGAGAATARMEGRHARTAGKIDALTKANRLQGSMSSTVQGMATNATQAAIQASQNKLDADMNRYQSNTNLMSDLAYAGAYGLGNYFKTGNVLGMEEAQWDKAKGRMGKALGLGS